MKESENSNKKIKFGNFFRDDTPESSTRLGFLMIVFTACVVSLLGVILKEFTGASAIVGSLVGFGGLFKWLNKKEE